MYVGLVGGTGGRKGGGNLDNDGNVKKRIYIRLALLIIFCALPL